MPIYLIKRSDGYIWALMTTVTSLQLPPARGHRTTCLKSHASAPGGSSPQPGGDGTLSRAGSPRRHRKARMIGRSSSPSGSSRSKRPFPSQEAPTGQDTRERRRKPRQLARGISNLLDDTVKSTAGAEVWILRRRELRGCSLGGLRSGVHGQQILAVARD